MNKLLSMLAFLMVLPSVADAARTDGRGARAAVLRNLEQRGLSTRNIRVHAVGLSRSGKSLRILVENTASKTVRAMNYADGVARETPTGLVAQSTGKGAAHQKLHRDPRSGGLAPIFLGYVKVGGVKVPRFAYKSRPGTYSGESKSGLSSNGDSMIFTSKTDRHPGAKDRVLVSVRTGQTRLFRD